MAAKADRPAIDPVCSSAVNLEEGGAVEVGDNYLHRWFEEAFGDASSWSCFFNLANTILGAGMLGLPYAFATSGWVLGSVLLVIFGLATVFALHILSVCALKLGTPASFYTIAMKTMPQLTLVIDIAVVLMTLGVGISYLIVVSDLMPDFMEQLDASHAARSRDLWVFIGFALAAPLSCLKRMDALKFTSFLCLAFVVFIVIVIVLYAADTPGLDPCASVDDDGTCVGNTTNVKVNITTFQTMPIIVFAYTCHQNIFGVTNEIRRLSQRRVDWVINRSVGLSFIVYLVIACCGYYTYGDAVDSNILVSFPRNVLTSTARLFVSFIVTFSYPLQCYPCRMCVLSLLHHWDNYRHHMTDDMRMPPPAVTEDHHDHHHVVSPVLAKSGTINTAANEPGPRPTAANIEPREGGGYQLSPAAQEFRYWVVTACYLGLTLLLALTVNDFGLMLGIVGATGSTMVSFILPGFFYYILFKDEQGPQWKLYLALAMGIAGLLIMPVCLTLLFI